MSESPAKPRIAIGSDHAGFAVKETIKKYLEASGYSRPPVRRRCLVFLVFGNL